MLHNIVHQPNLICGSTLEEQNKSVTLHIRTSANEAVEHGPMNHGGVCTVGNLQWNGPRAVRRWRNEKQPIIAAAEYGDYLMNEIPLSSRR